MQQIIQHVSLLTSQARAQLDMYNWLATNCVKDQMKLDLSDSSLFSGYFSKGGLLVLKMGLMYLRHHLHHLTALFAA